MNLVCPDCFEPVDVKPGAKDGRCWWCRQDGRRPHSQPRQRNSWQLLLEEHGARRRWQP